MDDGVFLLVCREIIHVRLGELREGQPGCVMAPCRLGGMGGGRGCDEAEGVLIGDGLVPVTEEQQHAGQETEMLVMVLVLTGRSKQMA